MKRLVEKIRRLKGGFDRFEYFLEKDYVINVNEDGYIHIRYFGTTLNYLPKSNHVTSCGFVMLPKKHTLNFKFKTNYESTKQ